MAEITAKLYMVSGNIMMILGAAIVLIIAVNSITLSIRVIGKRIKITRAFMRYLAHRKQIDEIMANNRLADEIKNKGL